jgi:hypothetical protein
MGKSTFATNDGRFWAFSSLCSVNLSILMHSSPFGKLHLDLIVRKRAFKFLVNIQFSVRDGKMVVRRFHLLLNGRMKAEMVELFGLRHMTRCLVNLEILGLYFHKRWEMGRRTRT